MYDTRRAQLHALIDRFDGLRVTVIGDAMLDSYLHGAGATICREAPVPVVTLRYRADEPGGAANTAANLRALGAEVTLLAVVGDDAEGAQLRRALERCGVATDGLIVAPGRATLTKHRILADTQMVVRFDQGSTEPIAPSHERVLLDRLALLFAAGDAVVVSDYGYGVVTPRVIAALAELQQRHQRVLAVDSKQLAAYSSAGVTLAKPNRTEALTLLDAATTPPEAQLELFEARGAELLARIGAQTVAVTLDVDGALIFSRGAPAYRTLARPTSNDSAAGAGDTFVGAMVLALAAGAAADAAAEIASAAAAVVVSGAGTTRCSSAALAARVGGGNAASELPWLCEQIGRYREQGKRIVFTNGCFDILHRGHITYLNQARELGDVLVVGINSDASIRRLKGEGRPINSTEDRVEVLAALSCIDHLIVFEDDTPCELIRAIRPDVFVKGGDYTRDQLVEAPLVESLGGRVEILPYIQDRSTTRLIARIRATNEGAELAREVGA
jgi:D-beta-D-heptose 7-phosphate kinase / D-beta-D-heptose 1-phosphate adenosyltransferase